MPAAARGRVSKAAHARAAVPVGRDLIRLAQIIVRLENVDLTRIHGLSYRQMRILLHIHSGVTSSTELAKRFGITPPAISETVDSMVQKGLIERHFGATQDRRAVVLALTEAGEELYEATQASEDALARDIVSLLSPAEVEQLGAMVSKLMEANQQRLFDLRSQGEK